MSSVLGTLGQGALTAGPQVLAGYGQGVARGEQMRQESARRDAALKIQQEGLSLRRVIAEREAEYKNALLEIKEAQSLIDAAVKEALRLSREAQAGLSEERATDLRETRPGRIESTKNLARGRGLSADVTQKNLELGLPGLNAEALQARIAGLKGDEAREALAFPAEQANLRARTGLAQAQAGTIREDDKRLAAAQAALVAFRANMLGVARSREERMAREGRDRTAIARMHALAHQLTAQTGANVSQETIRKLQAETGKIKGSFPPELLAMLDRDIKVGFQKGFRGMLLQDPVAVAARDRVSRILSMMWGSIHVDMNQGAPGSLPGSVGAPGGPPALPPAGGEPGFWEGLLGLGEEVGEDLGEAAMGIMGGLQGGPLGQPGSPIETLRSAVTGPQVNPVGEGGIFGRGPAAPRPANPANPPGSTPGTLDHLIKTNQFEQHMAYLRSTGDQKTFEQWRKAYQAKTGKVFPVRTYQAKPYGLSDGDIDFASVLLKRGSFEQIGRGAAAAEQWEEVTDLIRAWQYLKRPDPATIAALKRRWRVPASIVPRSPARR